MIPLTTQTLHQVGRTDSYKVTRKIFIIIIIIGLGTTYNGTYGLLLVLQSGVTPGSAWGTAWVCQGSNTGLP